MQRYGPHWSSTRISGRYDADGSSTYDSVRIKEIEEYLPSIEQIREQMKIAEEEYKMKMEEKNKE